MSKIRLGALPSVVVKIPQPVQLLPPQLPGVLSVHWSVHVGKMVKSYGPTLGGGGRQAEM
jgi:hypothetical protein